MHQLLCQLPAVSSAASNRQADVQRAAGRSAMAGKGRPPISSELPWQIHSQAHQIYETPCMHAQAISQRAARRSALGVDVSSPNRQVPRPSSAVGSLGSPTASGEASRGRSPEPDPTGAEDSPLSQVLVAMIPQ